MKSYFRRVTKVESPYKMSFLEPTPTPPNPFPLYKNFQNQIYQWEKSFDQLCVYGEKQLPATLVQNNNFRQPDTCWNVSDEIKLWEMF